MLNKINLFVLLKLCVFCLTCTRTVPATVDKVTPPENEKVRFARDCCEMNLALPDIPEDSLAIIPFRAHSYKILLGYKYDSLNNKRLELNFNGEGAIQWDDIPTIRKQIDKDVPVGERIEVQLYIDKEVPFFIFEYLHSYLSLHLTSYARLEFLNGSLDWRGRLMLDNCFDSDLPCLGDSLIVQKEADVLRDLQLPPTWLPVYRYNPATFVEFMPIFISSENTITYNGEEIDLKRLEQIVQEFYDTQPPKTWRRRLFDIQASSTAKYGVVFHVAHTIRRALHIMEERISCDKYGKSYRELSLEERKDIRSNYVFYNYLLRKSGTWRY